MPKGIPKNGINKGWFKRGQDKSPRAFAFIKGHSTSKETRRKIGLSHKGMHWKLSEESKKNIAKALIGHSTSQQTREKISKTLKGHLVSRETRKKISEANRGKISWWKGKHLSEKTKRLLSKKTKGRHHSPKTEFKKGMIVSMETRRKLSDAHKGEKSYLWRGGITPINNRIRGSIEYKLWQDSVFSRDGYSCKKCIKVFVPYNLVGHHVLNFSDFPELRFAIDNGITFCKKCHKLFHHIYGRKNNTKRQIEEFLNKNL